MTSLVPAVPSHVSSATLFGRDESLKPFYLKVVSYAFALTFIMCVLGNGIMTCIAGTFSGSDSNILYFRKDLWNLGQFVLICPAYVALDVCVIVTAMMGWSLLNVFSSREVHPGPTKVWSFGMPVRISLFFAVSFAVSAASTSAYFSQLSHLKIDQLYWFFSRTPLAEPALNVAGIYYFYMIAILMFVTAMAVLCYLSMCVEVFHLAKALEVRFKAKNADELFGERAYALPQIEQKLRFQLANFTWCSTFAKIATLVYGLNLLAWQHSPMGRLDNGSFFIAALAVFSWVAMRIPRLQVAMIWFRIKQARSNADDKTSTIFEAFQFARWKKAEFLIDGCFAWIFWEAFRFQTGVSSLWELLLRKWMEFTGLQLF